MTEERPKLRDGHFNNPDQRLQRRPDYPNLGRGRFEDYVDGYLEVHVHYRLRRINNDPRDFCAVFQRSADEHDGAAQVRHWRFLIRDHESPMEIFRDAEAREQEAMFVGYVAGVKEQQSVVVRPSAIERLHPLQACKCIVADPVAEFLFSTVESGRVSQDREVDGRVFEPLGVLKQDELPHEVIEGASRIVQAVSDQKGPSHERWLASDAEPERVLPKFGICFLGDGVSVSIENKGLDGRLEYVKVFACPPNLGAAPGETLVSHPSDEQSS